MRIRHACWLCCTYPYVHTQESRQGERRNSQLCSAPGSPHPSLLRGFENFHELRPHNCSGQPVPLLDRPHSQFLSYVLEEFSPFQLVPIASFHQESISTFLILSRSRGDRLRCDEETAAALFTHPQFIVTSASVPLLLHKNTEHGKRVHGNRFQRDQTVR